MKTAAMCSCMQVCTTDLHIRKVDKLRDQSGRRHSAHDHDCRTGAGRMQESAEDIWYHAIVCHIIGGIGDCYSNRIRRLRKAGNRLRLFLVGGMAKTAVELCLLAEPA
jgi:hypothetical protein